MYWYLEPTEKRPVYQLQQYGKAVEDGTFNKLPKDKQEEINNKILLWGQARGKNFYHPNDKEYKFFLHYPKMSVWVSAISGGNRSGKTATCVMDLIMQAEGWHPLQKENLERLADEALEKWVREWCKLIYSKKKWIASPPIRARCVAVDFPNYVDKIIGPEYAKWLSYDLVDPNSIGYNKERERMIKWKNGSFVEFMTTLQDLRAHGGAARHVVQVDEECFQDYWVENIMRVISFGGRMVYGATAVEGITWTEEAIFEPAEDPKNDEIYMIEITTYDNPMNTHEDVDRILKQCADDTDVDIRIYGKRKRKGGKVFPMAKDEHPWIIERFEIPKDKGVLVLAIDPHPHIPHAGLWIWIDYEGLFHPLIEDKPNFYEVAEFFENGSIPEIKFFVSEQENNLARNHEYCLLDPMAWHADQTKPEDKPIYEQLEEYGIYPQRGSKDREANIIRCQQMLTIAHPKLTTADYMRTKKNPDMILRMHPDAHPRLMTFEDLEVTRQERRNWHYPTYRRSALMEHAPIKRKPVDRDDHMMENEGRILAFFEEFKAELLEMRSEDETVIEHRGRKYYANDGTQLNVTEEDFNPDSKIEFTHDPADDG